MQLKVTEAMQNLLNAVDVEMRHDTTIQFLAPGAQVAWDNCCEEGGVGGQLWVRLVNIVPGWPQRDAAQKCAPRLYTATFGVGVIRCAHTLDDQGNPPTAAEMTGDATKINDDMEDMLSGIMSNLEYQYNLGAYEPLGPDGGCAGGEWTVSVRLQPCW